MNSALTAVTIVTSKITFKHFLILLFYLSSFMSYYPDLIKPLPALSHYVVPFLISVPLVLYIFFIRVGTLVQNKYLGALILYYAWIAISFIIHPASYGDTKVWFIRVSCYVLMAVTSLQVLNKKDLKLIGWVIVFIAITNGLYSFYQLAMGESGCSSHFHDKNLFSRFQIIAYAFLLIDWLVKSRRILDFRMFLLFVILGSIIHQQSRSGLLMFIISTGFIVLHTKNKRIIVSGVLVGIFLTTLIAVPVLKRMRNSQMDVVNYSDIGRISTMVAGVNMIKDKPILGVGYFNSIYEFKEYQNKGLVGLKEMTTIHNVYISIWAELGIVGLILFLYLNLGLFVGLYKKIWQRGVSFNDVQGELLYSLILLLYLFHGMVYHSFDYESFYWYFVIFGILLLVNPDQETKNQQEF